MPFSLLYSVTHAFRVELDICIIVLKVALLYTTGTYLTTDLWQDRKRSWLKQWLEIECLLIYILLPGWFFSPLVPLLSSLYYIFLWNLDVSCYFPWWQAKHLFIWVQWFGVHLKWTFALFENFLNCDIIQVSNLLLILVDILLFSLLNWDSFFQNIGGVTLIFSAMSVSR